MAIFIPLVTKFDDKGLKGAQRALKGFSNFATDIARVAATAIAGVGVASVREAAQFETSFSKIQGLVGVTASEIGALEDAAKRLGPSVGVSANEAADALFFITSAGLRGAAATEVLEASLKGAAIGLGDTKTIADLATSAVNAYGESNLGGAEAVDVLAEAVRLGKLAPEELAGAMGQVLPLASNLGVSFDQVGAALAGMSKTGTDASTASTQLRQILATLAKPTDGANKALADMGMSAAGLREQIREKGLFSTLETLTDAFDGNIEATTAVFGNIRALSGVLDLMGASAEDNALVFELMADKTGVLDEALAITSETAEFKFKKAMETARTSLINIGESILEKLSPRLDAFSGWMDKNGPGIEEGFIKIFDAAENIVTSDVVGKIVETFADLWPEIQDTAESIGGLVGALTPALEGALGKVTPAIGDIAQILADVTFFTDEVVGSFGGWESESGGFIKMLEEQLNPIERLLTALEKLAELTGFVRKELEDLNRVPVIDGYSNSRVGQITAPPPVPTRPAPPLPVARAPFQPAAPFIPAATFTPSARFLERRAGGGPVAGGRGYLVGEMGPEIFTPAAGGGNITPNDRLSGNTYNITVNAGMGSGSGSQLGEQIVTAIKRYERTSGPVFVSA